MAETEWHSSKMVGRNLKTSEFSDVDCCMCYACMYQTCSSEGGERLSPFPLYLDSKDPVPSSV